jgi:hypothetical protein
LALFAVGLLDVETLGVVPPVGASGPTPGVSSGAPYTVSGAVLHYLVRIGWGGRIRTYTIRINSAVSYRLDHAPADSIRFV